MNHRNWGAGLLRVSTVIAVLSTAAWGCNVPVFRYALENWRPDVFQVLVVSRGDLTAEQRASVDRLEEASAAEDRPANLQVHTIDMDKMTLAEALTGQLRGERLPDGAFDQIQQWVVQQSSDQPLMLVFFPRIWDRLAWHAELSAEHVEQLIDSPLRQEIADRILKGQSAVWVLLECGDAERDEKAWNELQRELKRSAEVVELPERELIETDEFFNPDVEIELRVEFSAVRISKEDERERAFAALLRGSESDLVEFDEPIAIPVYGRGRTYFALVGAGINDKTIEDSGRFLCGACSCQVKADNPGVDMLLAVDWNGRVKGSVIPDIVLPELTGIGALDLAATSTTADRSDTGERSASGDHAPNGDVVASAHGSQHSSDVTESTTDSVPRDESASNAQHRDSNTAITAVGTTTRGGTDVSSEASPQAASTDHFERRLLWGVAVGVVLAVSLLSLATFGLRRAG